MPRTIQLLKQIRNVIATVNEQSGDSLHKTLPGHAQVALNELMPREDSGFYLQYIEQGKSLAREVTLSCARNR